MLIIVDRSRTTHFFSLPPPSRRVLQFHLGEKESSAVRLHADWWKDSVGGQENAERKTEIV